MITTPDIDRVNYPEVGDRLIEDCGELQFCIDLIHCLGLTYRGHTGQYLALFYLWE